jgi:PAS domain S-box-containing protein
LTRRAPSLENEPVSSFTTDGRQRLAGVIHAQRDVMASGARLDEVLEIVCRGAMSVTGAEGAMVELAEGEEMVCRAATGIAASRAGARSRRDAGFSGRCLADGKSVIFGDAETHATVEREALHAMSARSIAVVPVVREGAIAGVLAAVSSRAAAFGEDDVATLELMAGLIGPSMVRASTEHRLLASEQRLQALAEAAPDAVVSIDSRGVILSWNRGATRLLGYQADAMLGKPVALLLPERYADVEERSLSADERKRPSAGLGGMVEIEVRTAIGTEIAVELSASSWAEGDARFSTWVLRDVR